MQTVKNDSYPHRMPMLDLQVSYQFHRNAGKWLVKIFGGLEK